MRKTRICDHKESLPINRPVEGRMVFETNIAMAVGVESLELTADEAREFNEDPDLFAARHFGLLLVDYVDWVSLHGTP